MNLTRAYAKDQEKYRNIEKKKARNKIYKATPEYKAKQKAYRKWYRENFGKYGLKIRKPQPLSLDEWLRDYRENHPCQKCGETRWQVLQFHHRDSSTKEFTISVIATVSVERLEAEIAKCDILCANCHIMEHSK